MIKHIILTELERCGADGVDFVATDFTLTGAPHKIYASYTKEEIMGEELDFPRTRRAYWRIEDGEKVYIDF